MKIGQAVSTGHNWTGKPCLRPCNPGAPSKTNTTPKKGGLTNPLKGGNFDIHFHRGDAEHAEDLFYFCFPLRRRKAKTSNPSRL